MADDRPIVQGELLPATAPPEPDVDALLARTNLDDAPHPAYLALLANLGSVNSQRTYAGHLKKAAQLLCERDPGLRASYLTASRAGACRFKDPDVALRLPWHLLRMDTVLWLKVQASVRDGPTAHVANPASVNGLIHALRGIAREAFRLGLMNGDDYERIRLVPLVRYQRLEAGRSVRPAELTHLVHALLADASPAGVRDTAILGILYAGGLRRAELAGLTLADVRADERGTYLRVVGKGNRERKAFVEPGARAALEDWLQLRGNRPGALFCRISKSGKLDLPLDPDRPCGRYRRRPSTRWSASALKRPGSTPRSPRTIFAASLLTHLLERGQDVFHVRRLLDTPTPPPLSATTAATRTTCARLPMRCTFPTPGVRKHRVVEVVVDRGTDRDVLLQCLDVPEPRHRPFPPSKRLIRVLGSIVEPTPAFLQSRISEHLHRSRVGSKPTGVE